MLLQVDIYLHTHNNKASGDKLPAPHQTLFTSLNTAGSSKILTVGRKDADVVLHGDKSVSRQHMTIELVSTEEFDEIEGKPSPRAAEGAEEVEACENVSIVAVLSDSSRFGTYLISEEAQKSAGDESGTEGDETDDEGQAVSQQASSQLSSISTRLLETSAARPVKVEKKCCLNALSKPNGRAVIQCGQNGSTLVIKRVALNMALSRTSKPTKLQWSSRAHLLGITFLENLEMNLTHFVTNERITNVKSLATWCLRKPMVTFDFLEALWNRESAADPLPEPSDFPPVAGDDETFWDEASNRKLWSHLTMLSCAAGDDMEVVCQAAGAQIVRLYDADNAIAAADEAKAEEDAACFFINSSVKKHSKIISHVKTKLKLPYVTRKLVVQCVSQQEPLRDSHGDVIGTPVEQDDEDVEEEETLEKPVLDEAVEDESDDAKSPAAVVDEPQASAAKSQAAESAKEAPEEAAAKSQASDTSKGGSQRSRKQSAPDEEEVPSSRASKRGRANEPSRNEETQMSVERMQQSEEKPAKRTSKRARDEEPSEDIIEQESNKEQSKPKKKVRTSLGGWTDTRKKPQAAAKEPSPEAADDDGDIPVADDKGGEDEETSMTVNSLDAAITGHFDRIAAAKAAADTAAVHVGNELVGSHDKAEQRRIIEQSRSLTETHLYDVKDAFLEEDRYWVRGLRTVRFSGTLTDGVLYRPGIVQDLVTKVEQALTKPLAEGIMVKGPHGVGKSHSLVNLVRKLVYCSSNKYLVTFIPDCEKWTSVRELLGAICDSFGFPNKADVIGRFTGNNVLDGSLLEEFLNSIDKVLESMGKQWVFVFDQINRIFAKGKFRARKDIGVLDFPFNWIKFVMESNRITSVISASASNEVSYKDRHEGFDKHDHSISMTDDEIRTLFPTVLEERVADVQEATCGVPLYVKEYLKTDNGRYEVQIEESTVDSLLSLKSGNADKWNVIQEATLSCLLALPTKAHFYDKKFFVQKQYDEEGETTYGYEALVPQVLHASRRHLWKQLMKRVDAEEATLLSVCREKTTLNSARGQHFEYIAIQRFFHHGAKASFNSEGETFKIDLPPTSFQGFSGRKLPDVIIDGIYAPYNTKFPAIDLVLKQGSCVVGVRIHVAIPHENVVTLFEGMCKAAGWPDKFENIFLLYLSPEEEVKDLVGCHVNHSSHALRTTKNCVPTKTSIIRVVALSRESFDCLQDLQWPHQCSIDSP